MEGQAGQASGQAGWIRLRPGWIQYEKARSVRLRLGERRHILREQRSMQLVKL